MTTIDPTEVRNAIRAAKAAARKFVVITWDDTGLHMTTDVRDARGDACALAVTTMHSDDVSPRNKRFYWRTRTRDLDGIMDVVGDAEPAGVAVDDRERLCIVSGAVSVALLDYVDDGDPFQLRCPRLDGECVASIGADGISAMIRASAAASSPTSGAQRHDLSYVFLARFDGRTLAIGTDGARMTIVPTSIANYSGDDGIICAVPLRVVRSLSRMTLAPVDGACIWRGARRAQQSMTVGSTRWSWEANALSLEFLDALCARAFAPDAAHRFGVTLDLRRSVRLAAWNAKHGQSDTRVALTRSGDVCVYGAQAPSDTLIRLDPKKLAAAIDEVNAVEISISGELDPVVVVGTAARALVMPCRR